MFHISKEYHCHNTTARADRQVDCPDNIDEVHEKKSMKGNTTAAPVSNSLYLTAH